MPRIADEILGVEIEEIFLPGRRARKVEARSLVCFWAARELGMALTDLARAFAMSVAGIGYTVERGELIARTSRFSLRS